MSQQERNFSDQENNESSACVTHHDATRTRAHNEPRRPADHTYESIREGLSAHIRRGRGDQNAATPILPPLHITEADRHDRSAVRRIVRQASHRIQRVLSPGTRHLTRRMRTVEANLHEMPFQGSNSVRRSSREPWHLRAPHQQGWGYDWEWPEDHYPTVMPDASDPLMHHTHHSSSHQGPRDLGRLFENSAGEPEPERFSRMHRAPPLVRRLSSPRSALWSQATDSMAPGLTPDGMAHHNPFDDSVGNRSTVSGSQNGAIRPTTNQYGHYAKTQSRYPARYGEHWISSSDAENSWFTGSTFQSTNDSGYISNSASTDMPYGHATIDRPGHDYAVRRRPELWSQHFPGGAATTPAEYNTSDQPFGQADENYFQRRPSLISLPPISTPTQGEEELTESVEYSETTVMSNDSQMASDYILDPGTSQFHVNQPRPIDLLTQPVNFDASRMNRFYTGPTHEDQSGRGYAGTPRALREQHSHDRSLQER